MLSNLRRLEFDDTCRLQPDVLCAMVTAATKLEVFGINWFPMEDSYNWPEGRTAGEIWQILNLRKGTLKEVKLDINPMAYDGEMMELGSVRLGSLRKFERLEVLKVGDFALQLIRERWEEENRGRMGKESFLEGFFPKGIREVTLWWPDGEMVPVVRRLAEVVKLGEYPMLRRFTVAPSQMEDVEFDGWGTRDNQVVWRNNREELRGVFGRGGVEFEVQTEVVYEYSDPLDGFQGVAF